MYRWFAKLPEWKRRKSEGEREKKEPFHMQNEQHILFPWLSSFFLFYYFLCCCCSSSSGKQHEIYGLHRMMLWGEENQIEWKRKSKKKTDWDRRRRENKKTEWTHTQLFQGRFNPLTFQRAIYGTIIHEHNLTLKINKTHTLSGIPLFNLVWLFKHEIRLLALHSLYLCLQCSVCVHVKELH